MAVAPTQAALIADRALLAEVVRRILTASDRRPLKIILFGSHARGDARADSDLDLLVIEETSDVPAPARATAYRMALADLEIDKDIIVYTPQEIAEWAAAPLAFPTTILREGKVLYERPG